MDWMRFLMDLSPQSRGVNLTLLSISVIAKMLATSPETVRRWITHGRPVYGRIEYLNGFQAGTPWRVSESELQRFLSSIQTSPRARRVKIGGGGGGGQAKQGEGSAALAKALQAGLRRPKRQADPTIHDPGSTTQ